MASGRFTSSGRLRLVVAVAALGLAMGIGGGVATASQQSPNAKSAKTAALVTPRTCGTPANYTSGPISISVRACLESNRDFGMFHVRSIADATVSTVSAVGTTIASCRIETEFGSGAGPGPSSIEGRVEMRSCTDAVNTGSHLYGDSNMQSSPGTYWNRMTVHVVTRTGTVRIAVATHSAALS
jgi:hypothetical protein